MEKISGIIPNSARVSSVDMKEAAPVRPGTPGFGRPEGVSSLRETAIAQDTARRGVGELKQQLDWRTKDVQQAGMVQNIADRFFAKNRQGVDGPAVEVDGSEMFSGSTLVKASASLDPNTPSINGSAEDPESESQFKESQIKQPIGLHPKGSFIDYSA